MIPNISNKVLFQFFPSPWWGFVCCCCFAFLMWTIVKVFIEYVAILLLFYVFGFWLQGIWDLSFLPRDQTCTFCIGSWSLNHWTSREVPQWLSQSEKMIQPHGIWCLEYHSHCLLLLPVSLDFLCLILMT